MTMVSRSPRQIVGYDVAFDKSSQRIQKIQIQNHESYLFLRCVAIREIDNKVDRKFNERAP